MGNDGGSIPDRRDLVRSKPKVVKHSFSSILCLTRGEGRTSRQEQPDAGVMDIVCALETTSTGTCCGLRSRETVQQGRAAGVLAGSFSVW